MFCICINAKTSAPPISPSVSAVQLLDKKKQSAFCVFNLSIVNFSGWQSIQGTAD